MTTNGATKHLHSKKLKVKSADLSSKGSAFLLVKTNDFSGGEKMRRILKRGQSTLEYAIIWTAIVGAILYAAGQFLGGEDGAISTAIQSASSKITTEVNKILE